MPLVKPGDIVRKGDVLIGGWLEGKFTGVRYVHGIGDVEAKVWYSTKIKKTLNQTEKIPTGEKEEKYSIKFNNFQINFYKVLTNFKKYDRIVETEKIKLFSNFYLPIELVKITNSEYEKKDRLYEVSELRELILEEADKELKQQMGLKEGEETKILNRQVNEKIENNALEIELIYEVKEKIGVEEKIII